MSHSTSWAATSTATSGSPAAGLHQDWKHYLAPGAVLAFLLWGTHERGLIFFSQQRLAALGVIAVGSLVVARYGMPVGWKRPAVVALLLHLAGYVVSLPLAASTREAVPGFTFIVASTYAFVLGAWVGRRPGGVSVAATTIGVVAAAASWYGFLVMAGVTQFPDAFVSGRLGSTFQYANTFAALAAVGTLASFGMAPGSQRLGWRHLLIHASFLALLLTVSRGGLLAFLVAAAGFVAFTLRHSPRLTLLFLGHGAVATLAFARVRQVTDRTPPLTFEILAIIAGSALVVTAGLWLLEWALDRADWSPRVVTGLAVLALLAAGTVGLRYGGYLVERLLTLAVVETDSVSDLSRRLHLLDALRIVRDHPLGLGHRGWWLLYPQYQPYAYVINIVHSHLGETVVAAGVLGATGLIGLWLTSAWNYLRGLASGGAELACWHALFWALAALGVHSVFIDADMNFLVISFIAFAGFGVLTGAVSPPEERIERGRARWAVAVAGGVVALGLAGMIIGDWYSNRAGTYVDQGRLDLARSALKTAMVLNPSQPFIRQNAAALAVTMAVGPDAPRFLTEARRYHEQAIALDPYRADLYVDYAAFLGDQGDLKAARTALEKAVSLAPWQAGYWERLIDFEIEAYRAYQEAGDKAKAQEHLEEARRVVARMRAQQAKVPKTPPGLPGIRFDSPFLVQLLTELDTLK